MSYPYLDQFSKYIKIDKKNLVEAFEIEKKFNIDIQSETSFEKRKELYKLVYSNVHSLYGKDRILDYKSRILEKKKVSFLFKKEFKDKSILDVGCGDGALLYAIHNSYSHKLLMGIDISTITPTDISDNIKFINEDIIKFDIKYKFDVVVLDNVYEHISKRDKDFLLDSISNAVKRNGKVIFLVPNKLFGPWDVTRICDFTYSGKTTPMGTHLNETTYSELINELSSRGFSNFSTPLPIRKIKFLLFFIRFPAKWMCYIENNRLLLSIVKKIKFMQKPIFRFETILIATKL
ncbi:class I SAM-dependent methyltransferase [Telluribacter humicola]|uniref:class I SAM-dependent methyltransferase n=1 Tax=Telluribacter humicola TaxID=1720261 RepID=UPI001A96FDE4|nr:class I SAM-dependent methyltransferase [Telluribacter humicola]